MPTDRRADSTPWPLRHQGPCGPRRPCYRPDCRERFDPYLTVELVAGRALYYCHRTVQPVDDLTARMLAA